MWFFNAQRAGRCFFCLKHLLLCAALLLSLMAGKACATKIPNSLQLLPMGDDVLAVFENIGSKSAKVQTTILRFDANGESTHLYDAPGGFECAGISASTLYLFRKHNYSVFTIGADKAEVKSTESYRIPLVPVQAHVEGDEGSLRIELKGIAGKSLGQVFRKNQGAWQGIFYGGEDLPVLSNPQWINHQNQAMLFGLKDSALCYYRLKNGVATALGKIAAIGVYHVWVTPSKEMKLAYFSVDNYGQLKRDLRLATLDLEKERLIDDQLIHHNNLLLGPAPIAAGIEAPSGLWLTQLSILGGFNVWRDKVQGDSAALADTDQEIVPVTVGAQEVSPFNLNRSQTPSSEQLMEGFAKLFIVFIFVLFVMFILLRFRLSRSPDKRIQAAGKLLPRRITALLIDVLVGSLFVTIGLSVSNGMGPGTQNIDVLPEDIALALALGLPMYFFVMEAMTGRTIGKRLMGLMVVHVDGRHLTFLGALLRNGMRFIDFQPVFTCLVGVFSMLISRDGSRLGDLVAQTRVVDARVWSAMVQGEDDNSETGNHVDKQA